MVALPFVSRAADLPALHAGQGRLERASTRHRRSHRAPLEQLARAGHEERELHGMGRRPPVFPRSPDLRHPQALELIPVEATQEIGGQPEAIVGIGQVQRGRRGGEVTALAGLSGVEPRSRIPSGDTRRVARPIHASLVDAKALANDRKLHGHGRRVGRGRIERLGQGRAGRNTAQSNPEPEARGQRGVHRDRRGDRPPVHSARRCGCHDGACSSPFKVGHPRPHRQSYDDAPRAYAPERSPEAPLGVGQGSSSEVFERNPPQLRHPTCRMDDEPGLAPLAAHGDGSEVGAIGLDQHAIEKVPTPRRRARTGRS